VTMDATPPQGETSPFFQKTGIFGLHVDWLRQRWDKYVVNYSMRTQAAAVAGGWSAFRSTRKAFGTWGGIWLKAMARWAAVPGLLAGGAIYLLYRRRRRQGNRGGNRDPRRLPVPYARLLQRLERSGYRPSPGISMEGMLGTAVRTRPELSEDAARFLALYHRDRFGPAPRDRAVRAESFSLADRLRRRLSAPVSG
jgi:hypothetical protein